MRGERPLTSKPATRETVRFALERVTDDRKLTASGSVALARRPWLDDPFDTGRAIRPFRPGMRPPGLGAHQGSTGISPGVPVRYASIDR